MQESLVGSVRPTRCRGVESGDPLVVKRCGDPPARGPRVQDLRVTLAGGRRRGEGEATAGGLRRSRPGAGREGPGGEEEGVWGGPGAAAAAGPLVRTRSLCGAGMGAARVLQAPTPV